MRFLITGTAGFIGFHLARRLLADGHFVAGFDGMTPYYDPKLKAARHAILARSNGFRAHLGMLEDRAALERAAEDAAPDVIVHLAAQAGVRYSLEAPKAYVDANLVGTANVLEIARALQPRHLLIASTSSVYGLSEAPVFRETDPTDQPITLYAATKKAGEVMAHSYAHLFEVPTTLFRFFTVYGPWGRPDMALFKFVSAILAGAPIDVYGEGRQARDFTYIDDLVEAIVRLIDVVPVRGAPASAIDTLSPVAPHRIVNIAGGAPVQLIAFIETIERVLGLTAERRLLPMQPGDVPRTYADPALLRELTGYVPDTDLETGVTAFVDWYRAYHAA
ncbi:NAD-dependent epimerase/dehydratase family protein [Methylobrevis albus]|uniref:GDP-mannose 4,6-dehydratase n=1 Tax=Methylobrevis albus TaxID=2793297 RepID=A0A931MWH3_9HYPH|nr:NAD-dependent epimerase/dehydratase family protein [Methylobrevis albus]MBH0236993.1 GDP-mannose 4,6-dehydratase [Methylobrevis albus]